MREALFEQRTTEETGDNNPLVPIVEADDAEMEVASDEERQIFDKNDLDNELKFQWTGNEESKLNMYQLI